MGPHIGNGQYSNGTAASHADYVGHQGFINRVEYIRLLQQALDGLGYSGVAAALERESGIEMQPHRATLFQESILRGDWEAAAQLLRELAHGQAADVVSLAGFAILQQKYLEAVVRGDTLAALQCLRSELTPLKVNEQQLHSLAALLVADPSEVAQRAAEGGLQVSRPELLSRLQALLPPAVMLPERRLEALVEQALLSQVARCPYHNAMPARISLLTDYQAGVEQLPTSLNQVLERHTDEVWHLAFSNRGHLLASASKDGTAIIWVVPETGPVQALHELAGHEDAISFVAWSPDDSQVLTCGKDTTLRLWDAATGACTRKFEGHSHEVTAAAWLPDGRQFLSGSIDKTLLLSDLDGNVVRRWKQQRINDLALSPDGGTVVSVCNEHAIRLFRLADNSETSIQESEPITSLALSPDGEFVLANLNDHTLHLWRVGPCLRAAAEATEKASTSGSSCFEWRLLPKNPHAEYIVDPRKGRFVIRSCFGGPKSSFVVSGSEDCQIYIWHRDSGRLLASLAGHSGTVNSVAWSPANPYLMASASDDKTIRIWVASTLQAGAGAMRQ